MLKSNKHRLEIWVAFIKPHKRGVTNPIQTYVGSSKYSNGHSNIENRVYEYPSTGKII